MNTISTLAEWIQKPLEYKPEIASNDIVGWILAFVGGIIVYKIVDGFQTRIARHTMVRDIEELVNSMLSENLAINENAQKKRNSATMRTVLDDEDIWIECGEEKPIIHESQRYIRIRTRHEDQSIDYLSTRAIHEYVLLFRRIEKLYKDGIVKPIDLSDMWREILPFGSSGRLCFLSSYLSTKDIEPIAYVIAITLLTIKKHKNDVGIEYFEDHYKKSDFEKYYLKNTRFRMIDLISMNRIKKLFNTLN